MNLQNKTIFLAGHNGMLGKHILKELKKIKTAKILTVSRKKLDLSNGNKTESFFKKYRPDVVINSASLVGGIKANYSRPADFIIQNNTIQNNLLCSSLNNNIKFFCFIGSSCIYPKFSKQPIMEKELLSSTLEPTNEYYALAKIIGLKTLEAINKQHKMGGVCVMPCNLYSPFDNYFDDNSHVISAIIRKSIYSKIKNKKSLELWGNGSPLREFMHAEDAARAIILAIRKTKNFDIINIGTGAEITIKDLAHKVNKIVGYNGKVIWNTKMPNGTPRKVLNINKLKKLGFKPKYNLDLGLKKIIQDLDQKLISNSSKW